MTDALKRWQTGRVQLYLRVKHPGIDPADLTHEFGLQPEHAVQAGAAVSDTGLRKLHTESYWLAALPTQSLQELTAWTKQVSSLPQQSIAVNLRSLRLSHATGIDGMQILIWLRTLEAQRDLIQRINSEGGSVTVVVQRPDRDVPFNLSPHLAQRLAELEIALEID